MQTQQKKLQELLLENAIGIEEFAMCLGITEKQAEVYCSGKKGLSGTMARQIEQTFSKPAHWLASEGESGPSYDLFG